MVLPIDTSPSPSSTSQVVIDTNVLLDWLVFRNPETEPLALALSSGRLAWLATATMLDEWERVLTYEVIAARNPDHALMASAWERHARFVETAPRAPMRCGDPDDQKFIDLAVSTRSKWLLTKDRELLKLAKRARAWGVAVLSPADWVKAESQ